MGNQLDDLIKSDEFRDYFVELMLYLNDRAIYHLNRNELEKNKAYHDIMENIIKFNYNISKKPKILKYITSTVGLIEIRHLQNKLKRVKKEIEREINE